MLIECQIRRKLGSTTIMDDDTYHFAPTPDSDGAHVCEVTKRAHIKRFLENDVYNEFGKPQAIKKPKAAVNVVEEPAPQAEPEVASTPRSGRRRAK